jgi:DNA-binding response OmpR family regulator
MDERPSRILLIDGDRDSYVHLRKLLSEIGDAAWQLEWTDNYDAALASIRRGDHDLYLVDDGLAGLHDRQLLHEARQSSAQASVLVLIEGREPAREPEALEHGAADYLPRAHLDAAQLRRALRYAVERRKCLRELERERYLLRALMENLPDNIYFKDINSRFLRVSKGMAHWFGTIPRRPWAFRTPTSSPTSTPCKRGRTKLS